MRTIKFRAWCPQSNRMLAVRMIDFAKNLVSAAFDDGNGFTDDLGSVKLMQYTGLKDRNGREIYEGDVLESNVPLGGGTTRSVVRWNEAGFIGNGSLSNGSVYMRNHQPVVVGNVYENPELIGGNAK